MVTAETHARMPTQCLVKVNYKSISQKKKPPVLSIEKFSFLVLARDTIILQTPNYPFFPPLSVKWSLTGG